MVISKTALSYFGGAFEQPAMAASRILTPFSPRLQVLTPTVDNLSLLMPDARKLKLGGEQFWVINKSADKALFLKDNSDGLIVNLLAGEGTALLLYEQDIFTPDDLTNVAAWYRFGSDHTIRISGPDLFLIDWADQGPGGHDLDQTLAGDQPKIENDVIEFDGIDHNMTTPSHPDFGLLNGFAIFTVLDTTEAATNRIIASKWLGGGNTEWILQSRHFAGANGCSFVIRNAAGTANFAIEGGQINDGNLHLVQAIYDGVDVKLRIDDITEVTTAAPNFRAFQAGVDVHLGSLDTTNNPTQQNQREMLILTQTPTAAELTNIRNYFGAKYGVAI